MKPKRIEDCNTPPPQKKPTIKNKKKKDRKREKENIKIEYTKEIKCREERTKFNEINGIKKEEEK